MISNPKVGRVVQVWYGPPAARQQAMPHHGRIGIVTIVSKARKCRNHMIKFSWFGDDDAAAVPAGNLRDPPGGAAIEYCTKLMQSNIPFDAHWRGPGPNDVGQMAYSGFNTTVKAFFAQITGGGD